MATRLTDAIQSPTSDTSFAISDAVALAEIVSRHGYDQVIDAVRMLRAANGDDHLRNHVGTAWLSGVRAMDPATH
jgi:hypothetical protein